MQDILRTLIKVLAPLLVLGAAIGGARALIKSRPEAPKEERPERVMLVEVQPVSREQQRLDVRAQGTVQAARQVRVQPQVAGRLVSISDELVPGGFVKKGDVLARIEAIDYRLNIKEREMAVEDARARLEVEKGQQVIAKKEWELFKDAGEVKGSDPSLALRKPQLKMAQLAVESAEARLQRARLDLRRTTVRAPFNAIVQSESVEVGQLVNAQTAIATLVGTDTFWIRTSVPLERLNRIKIPGVNVGEGQGSEVVIEQDLGGEIKRREGRVVRLLSELDQLGRMAQVIIEVEDPLGIDVAEGQPRPEPLLIGSYVRVVFEGSQQRALVEIPRKAVHDGDRVWVMSPDKTLDIRQITIAARRPDTVLVSAGLEDGEQLVTSKIGAPVQGMKLRTAADSEGGE